MDRDRAECGKLQQLLNQLGADLDHFLRFEHDDALRHADDWKALLEQTVPVQGAGTDRVMRDIGQVLVPNGAQISHPGFSSFITTGPASIGVLASVAGAVASPQRISLTAFNYLEELSLQWLADMFGLPDGMRGVYSSGGSVANLVALGAARQWACEQRGIDPARDGIQQPCRIYATQASHRTIQRAAGVLGMGRAAVIEVASDATGRMLPDSLQGRLAADSGRDGVPVAVVANAGTTSTGAIDPLRELGEIARQHGLWLHVDGAYGLPGILDPQASHLYDGLELADSVIVDPHKWLGAPVGIGATFVRDRDLLNRAFMQGESDYLEGSFTTEQAQHSLDSLGIPYADFGVELSAPARGAVVWALLREIGVSGLRERVCRHNAMARRVAERATAHPRLQLLQQPTLSICCFRYVNTSVQDLDDLNRRIHRKLVRNGHNMPSTAVVNGAFAIRPCFVGARTGWEQADALVDEVIATGDSLCVELHVQSTHTRGTA